MDKKPEQIAKPWFLNRSFFGFFFPVVILYFHLGGEWAVLIPRDVGMFWLALAAPLKSPLPAEMIPAFEICFIVASSVFFIYLIKDLNVYFQRNLKSQAESDPALQPKVETALKKFRNGKILLGILSIVMAGWLFWPHFRALGFAMGL